MPGRPEKKDGEDAAELLVSLPPKGGVQGDVQPQAQVELQQIAGELSAGGRRRRKPLIDV